MMSPWLMEPWHLVLIGLQFAVTWSSVWARWVRQLVSGEPVMLVQPGVPMPAALRRVRVTEDDHHPYDCGYELPNKYK